MESDAAEGAFAAAVCPFSSPGESVSANGRAFTFLDARAAVLFPLSFLLVTVFSSFLEDKPILALDAKTFLPLVADISAAVSASLENDGFLRTKNKKTV